MNKIKPGREAGMPINLQLHRTTRVKATPQCPAIEITVEIHRGKKRLRILGPDAMRIKHAPDDSRPEK